MNAHLASLIELQTLDRRITEIKDQERKTPELLQAAEAPLKEAQARLKLATSSSEALAKERRDKERDLEMQEAHIRKLRDFSELKSNKEYQARQFEIEVANKKKGEVEEQILLLMERLEKLQQDVKQAREAAAEAERQFTSERDRLGALSAELVAELAQLEEKRRTVAATLTPAQLERYDKIKAMRKDVAVVPVRNGICTGCRLQLPPQLVAEVKRAQELLSCSYCHRMLYWEGERPAVGAASAPAASRTDD